MATIDDFSKLEIRIGTVMQAEFVPETDRLVQLTVDFGEEEHRQIISGIRDRVEAAEDLVGKQFPFITNLDMRLIRGLESNGMILVPEGKAFLSPTEEVVSGIKIG
ncbi:hypothetical protein COB87_000885 [Candidatus Wolfebacteria bacterium]|nr:hypothetical protein [Candidatus Wolfebacteria bacterium]